MAHLKKLPWVALVAPVLLCCAAPLLAVGGAAAAAAVVGFACSGPGLAAAVLALGGAVVGIMVYRRRRQRGQVTGCCDLPHSSASDTIEEEPVLKS